MFALKEIILHATHFMCSLTSLHTCAYMYNVYYTPHPTPRISHCIPYTPHPIISISYCLPDTPYFTFHIAYPIPHSPYLPSHTAFPTPHTSHFPLHTSMAVILRASTGSLQARSHTGRDLLHGDLRDDHLQPRPSLRGPVSF